MSKDERARRARAARKAAKEAALATRIEQIRVTEHKAGFDKGVRHGTGAALALILGHAGRLYEAGQDVQAAAVRTVYRQARIEAGIVSPIRDADEKEPGRG